MCFYFMVDGGQLLGNFLLFTLQEVEWDCIIVMGFQQFLSLALQLIFLTAEATQLWIFLVLTGYRLAKNSPDIYGQRAGRSSVRKSAQLVVLPHK